MPKRRKEMPEEPAQEAPQEQAQAVVQAVAEATRMPGDEPPEKKWAPRTQAVTDNMAKTKFHFDHERHRALIEFGEGKPSDEVRTALKDGGFRWDRDEKKWEMPVQYTTREQDRVHALHVFNQVSAMIRQEKGIPAQQGIPI